MPRPSMKVEPSHHLPSDTTMEEQFQEETTDILMQEVETQTSVKNIVSRNEVSIADHSIGSGQQDSVNYRPIIKDSTVFE